MNFGIWLQRCKLKLHEPYSLWFLTASLRFTTFWGRKEEVRDKTITHLGRKEPLYEQKPLPSLSILLRHFFKSFQTTYWKMKAVRSFLGEKNPRNSWENSTRCLAINSTICVESWTSQSTVQEPSCLQYCEPNIQGTPVPTGPFPWTPKAEPPITAYSCRARSLGTLETTCKDRSFQKPSLSQDCNSCRTKTAPRGTAGRRPRALKPEPEMDWGAEVAAVSWDMESSLT